MHLSLFCLCSILSVLFKDFSILRQIVNGHICRFLIFCCFVFFFPPTERGFYKLLLFLILHYKESLKISCSFHMSFSTFFVVVQLHVVLSKLLSISTSSVVFPKHFPSKLAFSTQSDIFHCKES